MRLIAPLFAMLALFVLSASPARAGDWKHQVIPNDGDVLTYTKDGKVIFYLGCGRGFALHTRYPGEAGKRGKAHITISTKRGKMGFDGEFEEPVEVRDPEPMNFVTTFRQPYLGYAKQDPRVFGAKWNALKARFLDLLDAKGPITISAGKDSYELPPIEAGEWHKALRECRN